MSTMHPLLCPVSYSCSAFHEEQDAAVPWRVVGKYRRTKMREGDDVAHGAIWVFPASSSHFGTEAVFFHYSSLFCMPCLFCVRILYLSFPSLTI